jgi:hypothetical protein
MSGVSRWRNSGHLERAVETAGGQDAFDASIAAMLDIRDEDCLGLAVRPERDRLGPRALTPEPGKDA